MYNIPRIEFYNNTCYNIKNGGLPICLHFTEGGGGKPTHNNHFKSFGIIKKFTMLSHKLNSKQLSVRADKDLLPYSPIAQLPLKKKAAFTLAEVLITLGIIGVVAALTLPTLIQNYQKKVILTQLKKNYAIVLNWIQQAETREELQMKDWPSGSEMRLDEYWDTYIQPYFTQVKKCSNMTACGYRDSFRSDVEWRQWSGANWNLITTDSRILFQLGDGTVIFFPRNSYGANGNPAYVSHLYIDVNGTTGPNTYCKDVFVFGRGTQKGIEPIGCTKLIIDNNYEFPDDYPY